MPDACTLAEAVLSQCVDDSDSQFMHHVTQAQLQVLAAE